MLQAIAKTKAKQASLILFLRIFENFIWYATCNIIDFESIVAYQDKRGNFGGID